MNFQRTLTYIIALVWLINGLICKLLNLVPRHRQIVAAILGEQHAAFLTAAIGMAEMGMAVWVISRIQPQLNAISQIIIIAIMNILEFLLVPHLLLWGKANAFFAFIFILVIYYNQFILNKKTAFPA